MKIIDNVILWFREYKQKRVIFNQLKHLIGKDIRGIYLGNPPSGNKVTKKRVLQITNSLYRGVAKNNKIEKKEQQSIEEFYENKLFTDFKMFINKHFSDENKDLRKENEKLKKENENLMSKLENYSKTRKSTKELNSLFI